jgi:hypothetical protein
MYFGDMKKVLFLFFWLSIQNVFSQTITGVITDDVTKKGIAGVVVSDQATVVITDANGRYEIKATPGQGFIMISLPDGYKGGFYKRIESNNKIDFQLTKTTVVTEFSFIHASDTHIEEKSVNRTMKLKELADQVKPAFVLVCGDLVRDALRVTEATAKNYYQLYVDNISKFTVPVWSVPGNHEIFGIERHLSLVSPQNPLYGKKMFAHYLGPNYYSFNYGGFLLFVFL